MLYLISIYENRLFFEDLGINRIAAFLEERHIDYKFRYIKCNSAIDETIWDEIAASDFLGISVYDNNIDFADFIVMGLWRILYMVVLGQFFESKTTIYGVGYNTNKDSPDSSYKDLCAADIHDWRFQSDQAQGLPLSHCQAIPNQQKPIVMDDGGRKRFPYPKTNRKPFSISMRPGSSSSQ